MAVVAPGIGGADRIPPNNLEAEMAVLGSILVDREMMSTITEILSAADFYAHVHETVFAALVRLYDRGEPLDKITLAEELRNRNQLDKVGGLPYLSSLMDTVPTAASAEYYAHIVREKACLRGLIHAGTQITRIGFENEEDVEGALDQSEQIVYEVGKRQKRGEFESIVTLLKGAFEQIDKAYHSRGVRTGLTSGFRDFDEFTAGFQPGNFVILAARPGMGKTSFALSMAAAAAREEKKPVALFSLEMTNEELVTRLLCAEARINSQHLRRGNVKDADWEKISMGMSVLSQLPIYIDDSGSVSVTEIRSRCRRLQSGDGLCAVFIDYLQLVRPSGTTRMQNRNDELSEICRTLKATAKDLQIPIIALAQLNRGVETRNDKRPMLADLRDCLAGSTLVTDATTGERVSIERIVREGLRFDVWALDDRLKLVQRPITDAWAVGERPVFEVTTRSGRVIRTTAGHRFLTVAGWRTLGELSAGDCVALPLRYGEPRAPASSISPDRALLLGRLTVAPKHVPEEMFSQSCESVAAFLRGLFDADGSRSRSTDGTGVTVRLSTISRRLAYDVQHLLLRLGVGARVSASPAALWTVAIMQRSDVVTFMNQVGFLGSKLDRGVSNVDSKEPSHASLGWRDRGTAMSARTCAPEAERLQDQALDALAFSDVLWDPIATVVPCGDELVYDISVGELHNFCADDFITHNSGAIEQEADLVSFLYRDSYYNPESAVDQDLTELIISKNRSGPVGTIKLRFIKEHTLFLPYGESSHFSGP